MKASLGYDMNSAFNQMQMKLRSPNQDRKSRQNSKEGHMNPLKMKSSFLRQSLNLNSNDQFLPLNLPSSSNNQTKQTLKHSESVLPSDRIQDLKIKKLMDRYSQSPNQKDTRYPDLTDYIEQSHKDWNSIQLSDRTKEHIGLSSSQKGLHQGKQNKDRSLSYSTAQQNGLNTKIQVQSNNKYQQRANRFSQSPTTQSVVLDNSLADYSSSINFSSLNQDSSISIIKDQVQLILKRLAKNQCDIESLKRDKNIDVHFQGVRKQLSLYQNKFQLNQKRLTTFYEKMDYWAKTVEDVKFQLSQSNKETTFLNNQVKGLERKFLLQILKKNEIIPSTSSILENSSKISEMQTRIKSEIESLLHRIDGEWEKKIQSKLNELRLEIKSQKVTTEDKDLGKQNLRTDWFKVSGRKSHNCIGLLHKEVLKVRKNSELIANKDIYVSSDRSKLLANVFNTSKDKFNLPGTPIQGITKPEYGSKSQEKTLDIEINQVEYFIDCDGYLLDSEQFYIVDDQNQQIKLDASTLELLKKHNVLRN